MRLRGKRVKITRLIQRGRYVVAVPIEMVYPIDAPDEPCYTADAVVLLKEVAERAEKGDIAWLKQHGTVYERVGAAARRKRVRRPIRKQTARVRKAATGKS